MTKHLEEFEECVEDAIYLAEDIYQMDLSGLVIACSIKGRTAARAGLVNNFPFVNCNLEAIEKFHDNMCRVIAPHEVAHIVCDKDPELGKDHNRGWKDVCLALGGTGQTRHNMNLSPARTVYTYLYETTLGMVLEVGQTCHSRLQTDKVAWYTTPCEAKVFKWGYIRRKTYNPF